jgi:ParB family chromosome partitioning protein
MNKKRNALGRGLSAILRNPETDITSNKEISSATTVANTSEILIDNIQINPFQPRKEFNKENLYQLSESIRNLGIIQPITVRKLGYDKYQLISGERRLRASKLLKIKSIPAYIRIAKDQQMLEMALVENIQRQELNPIEIALSFKRLIIECNLTQEACGERLGKNRSTITNFLRLLKLPIEIQDGLQRKKITIGHARALINLDDDQKKINIFHDIIANDFSVREVEQIVKDFSDINYKRSSKIKKTITTEPLPFTYQKMLHDISTNLETEVLFNRNKKGNGKIIIPFENDKDLEEILKKFKLKN